MGLRFCVCGISKMLTPLLVELNITELCNRTCSFCPRSLDYPNLNLNMDIELAQEIANQCIGFTENIHLVGRGEPLLHPDFIDIVKVFAEDFSVKIVTNGDHLYKYIDQLHAILNLTSGKHKITYCLYDNDAQYNNANKLYGEYKDIFLYKTYDTGENLYDDTLSKKQWLDNRAGYFYKTKSSAPCYIPTNRVYIDYNGDVNLCCHDWKNKHVFGNIKDNHINNIWNTRMKSIKIQLANGNRQCLDACKGCDVEFDPLSLVYKHEYEITQFQRLKHLGIGLE